VYFDLAIYKDESLRLVQHHLQQNGGLRNSAFSAASGCGVVLHTAPTVLRATLLILITSISRSALELRLLHMSQTLSFGLYPTSHLSRAGVHTHPRCQVAMTNKFCTVPPNIFTCSALTLILLRWRIWCAPNNASRWQMGLPGRLNG